MKLNKKGQGLPLNVVIIAALVLIVLVVLVMIFTGKSKTFVEGTKSCETNGGTCKSACGTGDKALTKYDSACTDSTKSKCCIDLGLA